MLEVGRIEKLKDRSTFDFRALGGGVHGAGNSGVDPIDYGTPSLYAYAAQPSTVRLIGWD